MFMSKDNEMISFNQETINSPAQSLLDLGEINSCFFPYDHEHIQLSLHRKCNILIAIEV